MSGTHKALLLEKKFGDLVLGDVQTPSPGPGEILVKIHAAALNPVDWKIRKYGFFIEEFPGILGSDVAGEVAGLGDGVTDFATGDRVVFQGQYSVKKAGFQQYCLCVAAIAAKIPANQSYDDVVTIPVALTAAYVGLYQPLPHGFGLDAPVHADAIGKYKGTPLVVLGGASSVGQIALQLARHSGFLPIITTASLKNAEILKSLGATHVLDRNLAGAELADAIAKIPGADSVKYVYDAVSIKSTQETALGLLPPGGYLALVQTRQVEVPDKDKTIIQVLGAYRDYTADLLSTLYHDNLSKFLEQGVIKPNQIEVLPNGLAGIPDGLKRLENEGLSRVKLVAHPQETA